MIGSMALALLLAAQNPAHAAEMQEVAQSMQGLVGREFAAGIRIVAIAAEESTLVVTLDGPGGWRASLSPQAISDLAMGGFCQGQARERLVDGRAMRIDTLEAGDGLMRGPVVERCPD